MLILMRYLGSLKWVFTVKVSVGLMSRPLGCLVRGRSLAQARDWRVRFSSGGAVPLLAVVKRRDDGL